MGSGESDAVHVELVPENVTLNTLTMTNTAPKSRRIHQDNPNVNNNVAWSGQTNQSNLSIGGSYFDGFGNAWWPTQHYTYGSTTIYMYQITCPKCATMNFMQLETIIPCKKCKSRIKATQQKYDYEVPVQL